MGADDLVSERQPKACALGFRRKKRIEDALAVFRRDAGSLVADPDFDRLMDLAVDR